MDRDQFSSFDIDDLLDRWAYWRKGANTAPNEAQSARSPIYREADEIQRGSPRVKRAKDQMALIRRSLRRRIKIQRLIYERFNSKQIAESPELQAAKDTADRLQRVLSSQPSQITQLAFASLTHGDGIKKEIDAPIEEAIELEISRLPAHLRKPLKKNYLNWQTQETNAAELNISKSTFNARINTAKLILRGKLGCN